MLRDLSMTPLFKCHKLIIMNILVFTTSVSAQDQVTKVQPILTSVQAIQDFNFDLEDCDNILRVVSDDLSPRYIESLLNNAGFLCSELEY